MRGLYVCFLSSPRLQPHHPIPRCAMQTKILSPPCIFPVLGQTQTPPSSLSSYVYVGAAKILRTTTTCHAVSLPTLNLEQPQSTDSLYESELPHLCFYDPHLISIFMTRGIFFPTRLILPLFISLEVSLHPFAFGGGFFKAR